MNTSKAAENIANEDKKWFRPKQKPEKVCGCVYSLVGYLLYACPKHEEASNGE